MKNTPLSLEDAPMMSDFFFFFLIYDHKDFKRPFKSQKNLQGSSVISVPSFQLPVTDVASRTRADLGGMTHVPHCSAELKAPLRAD